MGERVGGGIFGRGCGIGGLWTGRLGEGGEGESREVGRGKREEGSGRKDEKDGGSAMGRRGQDGEIAVGERVGKMYRDEEILVMQTLCLKY